MLNFKMKLRHFSVMIFLKEAFFTASTSCVRESQTSPSTECVRPDGLASGSGGSGKSDKNVNQRSMGRRNTRQSWTLSIYSRGIHWWRWRQWKWNSWQLIILNFERRRKKKWEENEILSTIVCQNKEKYYYYKNSTTTTPTTTAKHALTLRSKIACLWSRLYEWRRRRGTYVRGVCEWKFIYYNCTCQRLWYRILVVET